MLDKNDAKKSASIQCQHPVPLNHFDNPSDPKILVKGSLKKLDLRPPSIQECNRTSTPIDHKVLNLFP